MNYFEMAGINFSSLKYYRESPAHFLHYISQPKEEPTDAMKLGSAVHTLVFEPEVFDQEFLVLNLAQLPVPGKDFRTKANKDWLLEKQAEASESGRCLLSQEVYQQAQLISRSVTSNRAFRMLREGFTVERGIQWTDPETGILCKGKPDARHNERGILFDLKTTRNASRNQFSRAIAERLYYGQVAMYSDGLEQVYGVRFDKVIFVAVETAAPYVCQVYFLEDSALQLGRTVYRDLLRLHKQCMDNHHWPGYEIDSQHHSGAMDIDIPAWEYARSEAQTAFH